MRYLRYGTATRVTVGPFLDKTDGITPEVALTVTGCHLTLMVDTAGVPTLVIDANATASAGDNDMVHVTGDDAGYYDLELTSAQTNYLGRAMMSINDVATHCPVFHEFTIIPANIYDSLILGTAGLLVDVNTIKTQAVTCAAGVTVLASVGTAATSTAQTGDCYGRIGAPAGASVSADVAAVKADTAAILVDTGTTLDGRIPAALVSGRMNCSVGAMEANTVTAAATAADFATETQASCDAAIVANNLDHICGNATAIPGIVSGTYLDQMMDDGTAVYDRATDSLQALRDAAATLATVADAVWDETLGTRAAGTTGEALANASAAGDPWATTGMSTAYTTPDTAGYILANASGAVSGIGADTDEILTRLPDATAGAQNGLLIAGTNYGATFTNAVTMSGGLVANVTGNITGNVSGSVGSVTAVSDKTGYSLSNAAYVTTADALLNRTLAEVTEGIGLNSGAGRNVIQALRILRNKWTLAADTLTVYKENDSTTSWTASTTTTVMNPINGVDPS